MVAKAINALNEGVWLLPLGSDPSRLAVMQGERRGLIEALRLYHASNSIDLDEAA